MNFLDIQIPDEDLRQQFIQAYRNGNYSAAMQILQNTQLDDKWLSAEGLNALTDEIVRVENINDPNFKDERIQIVTQLPSTAKVGEVFFLVT